jgi:hypothetical protein
MNKPWQPHALHILDAIAKIARIRARGDLTQDGVLYDAAQPANAVGGDSTPAGAQDIAVPIHSMA